MAFLTLWRASGGPELEKEFRFHSTRKWRADFAHLPSRTLIEIEGGIYVNGRHNRGAGFAADLEKYNRAALLGWTVLRFTTDMVKSGEALRDTLIAVQDAQKRRAA